MTVINASRERLTQPSINRVSARQPLTWLAQGFADFLKVPVSSMAYGGILTAIGVMFWLYGSPLLVLSLVTGFLLLGPFLAVGFYKISQRLERGERAHLGHALGAWRTNSMSLVLLAMLLAIVMVIWIRAVGLIVAIYFTANPTTVADLLFQPEAAPFIAILVISGAVLAGFVFAISAISWPMLLDRDYDPVTAVTTSVRAVFANLPAMIVWALLISGIVLISMVPLFLGLIVSLPVVAYATWHSYRDLVTLEP